MRGLGLVDEDCKFLFTFSFGFGLWRMSYGFKHHHDSPSWILLLWVSGNVDIGCFTLARKQRSNPTCPHKNFLGKRY